MGDFIFQPAVRENVPLLIGLAGGTGSGKTYTAMTLAEGLANGADFGVIDTESRRALHYAEGFKFQHCQLPAPFRPESYLAAIEAAAKLFPVVVVDSMSHEWAGEGGILDWQEEELDRMAGSDWKKREGCKMAAWIKPKTAHKHMMQRLLQVPCHLILCFRAEEKIEMSRNGNGKMEVSQKRGLTGLDGWFPVCEKNMPFELTTYFLFTADAPGVPKPIKLQDQHRAMFPLDRPVSKAAGQMLGDWARGGKAQAPAPAPNPAKKKPSFCCDEHAEVSRLRQEANIPPAALVDIVKEWGIAGSEEDPGKWGPPVYQAVHKLWDKLAGVYQSRHEALTNPQDQPEEQW